MRASHKGATFKHVDYDIACFRAGGTTSNNIFKKKKDYLYIVRKMEEMLFKHITFTIFSL